MTVSLAAKSLWDINTALILLSITVTTMSACPQLDILIQQRVKQQPVNIEGVFDGFVNSDKITACFCECQQLSGYVVRFGLIKSCCQINGQVKTKSMSVLIVAVQLSQADQRHFCGECYFLSECLTTSCPVPDSRTSFVPPDQGSESEEDGRTDGGYSDVADGHGSSRCPQSWIRRIQAQE